MFDIIVLNLLPLYALIALGYLAGRHLDVNLHSIARINMFILLPIVSFGAILNMDFKPVYVFLPFMLYAFSWANIMISYHASRKFWRDGSALLIGAGGANGNSVYFGLPLFLYLFPPEIVGLYLFMNLGPQVNNITTAYFFTARGQFSIRDSLIRVARFPVVHAVFLAVVLNLIGLRLGEGIAYKYWGYASGSIVFLGMMMVGIALGKLRSMAFDWKLTLGFFLSKFVLWPAMVLGFIALDVWVLGFLSRDAYLMMAIWSAMPLMGNLVAYAAEYNLHPERVAASVLASSVFVLVYIPVVYALLDTILPPA